MSSCIGLFAAACPRFFFQLFPMVTCLWLFVFVAVFEKVVCANVQVAARWNVW